MLGKPVIRGTRITVDLILRKLREGATEAQLVDTYPSLTPEDIRAAVTYDAETRFRARAARGAGKTRRGLQLLAKARGERRARRSR